MSNIVVIGSANMDSTLYVDSFDFTNPFSSEGLNILGGAKMNVLGGKGANQAVSACKQLNKTDNKVYFIGCIGGDESGITVEENLEKLGIDRTGILVLEEKNTDGRMIFVDKNGQNRMIGYGDCIKELKPDVLFDSIRKPILDNADFLVAQMKMPKETVKALIEYAEECGKPLLLDPTPLENTKMLFEDDLIRKVAYLSPNEEEAFALAMYEKGLTTEEAKERYEKEDKAFVLKTITELVTSHPNIVATLGENGVLYQDQGKLVHKKAYPTKCIDSTGAGDTFNGAFIAGIARGENIHTAIDYALVDCANKVQQKGAQNGMQTLQETEEYLRRMKENDDHDGFDL